MNLGHGKVIVIRWVLLLVFAVIPMFLLPGQFRAMKLEELIRHNNIDDSLKFTYAGDRQIRCFKENLDDLDGISYIFLPSYAKMEEIGVSTITDRVDFLRGNESISVLADEEKVCSFQTDEIYHTIFFNAKDEIIGEKKLMFLKSGNLPTMYVATKSGSMEKLDADKTYKEKGAVELYDENGKLLFGGELRSISGRGNHTFSFEKKSYQIKLNSPKDILGMGLSDTWILLCNVFDTAYIRNKLTYEMALQAGMPGSPESEYIDLYFNGVYAGMYQLSEKVEIGPERLAIADLEKENIALNGDSLDYVDPFVSEDGKQKGTKLKYSPEDITGGYLIEHDFGEKFDEATSGFVTRTNEAFSLKNPSHASESETAYISALFQEIEDAVLSEDGYNPETGKHFTDYIDLESWADKYLAEEISRNNGGGGTSSYFYKPKDRVSTKVFGGPVWDYDKGFIALSMITSMVILTIQSNIVLSLGMVGALSIVRFRTAIKDPMDLVFLFWSISVGIACGAGMLEIAVIGSLLMTVVIFVLDRLPLAKAAMILVVNADAGKEQTASVMELVKKYSRYHKVKSRNITDGQLDMVIELWVSEEEELVEEIARLGKVHAVSLMSHDGEVTF